LPSTPDFQEHRTYVTPPLDKKGLYVILASAREDFAAGLNRVVGVNFLLTDLVLVTRADGGKVQVTALGGESGKPVAGTELILYRYDWQRRHYSAETQRTDAAGEYTLARADHHGSYFLVGRHGDDLTIAGDNLYFQAPAGERAASGALVYTDRS